MNKIVNMPVSAIENKAEKALFIGRAKCSRCNKNTTYTTYPVREMKGQYNGKHYIFDGLQARCSECGKMVFPESISKYNQNMFAKAIKNNDLDV